MQNYECCLILFAYSVVTDVFLLASVEPPIANVALCIDFHAQLSDNETYHDNSKTALMQDFIITGPIKTPSGNANLVICKLLFFPSLEVKVIYYHMSPTVSNNIILDDCSSQS